MFTALVIVITLGVAFVTVHWVVPRHDAVRPTIRDHGRTTPPT